MACGVLNLGLKLPAGPAVMPCQTEGNLVISIIISLLTLPLDWLFTHKAVRTCLNICKNLPTEMGKYPRIP